ncbi:YdeI/OmpD-associated family protein [Planctomonas psychrotolerans]|uniref:YdeI/OmpD-associated family protein n=1 Tax=Planctomonas psychrotolerans TaxID=2528712 RepID=UPI00123C0F22|nr:YdeI/OmpD-associated family protein [Planctomonas psychrotolerans]
MEPPGDEEIVTFRTASEWDSWLERNGRSHASVWMLIAKKSSGTESVTVSDALDVALCWGWIDGQRRSYDDSHFLQRYTPRRRRSEWSQVNVDRVRALTEAGRMRPAGLAEVAAAQADGRWDAAYVAQRNVSVPDDLAAALAASERASARFAALGKTERYLAILQVTKARTPATRAARLARVVREWEDSAGT